MNGENKKTKEKKLEDKLESLQKQINVIYSRLSNNPFTRDYFNGKSHTFHKDDVHSEDK